jgi:hypothetical protein
MSQNTLIPSRGFILVCLLIGLGKLSQAVIVADRARLDDSSFDQTESAATKKTVAFLRDSITQLTQIDSLNGSNSSLPALLEIITRNETVVNAAKDLLRTARQYSGGYSKGYGGGYGGGSGYGSGFQSDNGLETLIALQLLQQDRPLPPAVAASPTQGSGGLGGLLGGGSSNSLMTAGAITLLGLALIGRMPT